MTKLTKAQARALKMLAEKACRSGQWSKDKINSTVAANLFEMGYVNVGHDSEGEIYVMSNTGRKALKEANIA